MKNWHCYLFITILFILNSVLWALVGCQVPLLLAATIMLLVHPTTSLSLKLYAISLMCFDYFLWFDQWGPPLMYLIPILAVAPALNQLLMPAARNLLPYALFTLAFSVQKMALEPLVTGVLPTALCTFLPYCGTILLMYIILKYCPPLLKLRRGTTP